MYKKKVIILGSTGGLGSEVERTLSKIKYKIYSFSSKNLNFLMKDSQEKINFYLKKINPDIVINCSGVFENNSANFKKIFYINTKPSWEIINYYINNRPKTKKLIILIGSTAYRGGRKNYILYSASKAALHSIYLGAKENFNPKIIDLKMIHPKKIETKMVKHDKNLKVKKVNYYSKKIINIINKSI